MTLPVLTSARVTLRSPSHDDVARIVELIGDYDVAKMLSVVPHPYSPADARKWLAQTSTFSDEGEVAFVIVIEDGLIGGISLGRLPKRPTLGYWLGKAYWGRGYMSEAARVALTWMFATHRIDEIISQAMDENPASLNVMRKLGFTTEGKDSCASQARGEARPSTVTRLRREDFLKTADA